MPRIMMITSTIAWHGNTSYNITLLGISAFGENELLGEAYNVRYIYWICIETDIW